MTNNEKDYEMCFRAENVFLPKNGYFGVSAATGGLADDHDVLHFLTSSLHLPGQVPTTSQRKFLVIIIYRKCYLIVIAKITECIWCDY